MRNLLLFLLVLIAVYYLRRLLASNKKGDGGMGGGAPSAPQLDEAEQVLPCAHCGLLVPASEGTQSQGQFFCSPEHQRLGSSRQ